MHSYLSRPSGWLYAINETFFLRKKISLFKVAQTNSDKSKESYLRSNDMKFQIHTCPKTLLC